MKTRAHESHDIKNEFEDSYIMIPLAFADYNIKEN